MPVIATRIKNEVKPAQKARYQHVSNYVSLLRQISGYYIGYVPNEYADQVSEESFYKIMRNDSVIAHHAELMAIFTAGEYCEVTCKDKKLQEIIVKSLSHITNFLAARKSMTEHSLIFGLGIQKKHWKTVTWRDYPGLRWQVPVKLSEVDRRRLRIERKQNEKQKAYWTIYRPKEDAYIVLEDRNEVANIEDGAAVQDYLWVCGDTEETNPYYEGLGDRLFTLAYIKHKTIQYWAKLGETWGKPFIAYATENLRGVIDSITSARGLPTLYERITEALKLIDSFRVASGALIDKEDDIRIHEAGSATNNILHELISYCDDKQRDLIMGSSLTTSTGDGQGSYAQSTVHRESKDAKVIYRRDIVNRVIEQQLIQCFLLRNKFNLFYLGIPFPEPGEVTVKVKVSREEMKEDAMQRSWAKNPSNAEKQL